MAPPPAQKAIPIPDELARFLEYGHIAYVATRGDDLLPECMEVCAVKVEAERGLLSIFLAQAMADRTLANLRSNGQAAVNVSRPTDHRTLQLKGIFVDERPAGEEDRAPLMKYLEHLARGFGMVGIPLSVCMRMVAWPSQVVRIAVHDIFEQTPGPGSGRRLDTTATPS
jgi:hypothetical protein